MMSRTQRYPNPQQTQQELMPTLDLAALSPRSQRRLSLFMDSEGVRAMEDAVSIQRNVAVSCRAIAAEVAVSQAAMTALQMAPQEAERIEEIVMRTHRNLCEIVDNGRGRW